MGSAAAIPTLEAETVAELLRGRDTREATLSALEEHATPIDLDVLLPAATALYEMRSELSAHEDWNRVCLLYGRMLASAGDDAPIVHGTSLGGGRYVAVHRSERTPLARTLRKSAEELTLDDARSFAAHYTSMSQACNTGPWSKLYGAWGISMLEGMGLVAKEDPLMSTCGPCRRPHCH